MADTEETDSQEGEAVKKAAFGLPVLIAVLGVVLLGAGAGLYFTGMLDGLLGKGAASVADGEAAHEGVDKGGHGDVSGDKGKGAAFLEVPTMNVTLNSEDGVARYLRLGVQLELYTQEDSKAIEAVMPRVIDRFQTYLRELRVKDLQGSGGIYRLQMELLWRVNKAADPVKVKDVLFQEILIQ